MAVLDAAWKPALSAPHLCDAAALGGGDDAVQRDVLALPANIAPYQYAVLPLRRRGEMLTMADDLHTRLLQLVRADFDLTASIGKRYRRQDEIGTPSCITVDMQSPEDNTVTVRDRDTMQQTRLTVDQLLDRIRQEHVAALK